MVWGFVTTWLMISSPIRLEYMTGWMAGLLFCALAVPILLLGMRSLNGLGPVRKWVAIGVRLGVLALFILILGGARWQRQHTDLEVMVLRDISGSTGYVTHHPGESLDSAIRQYLLEATRQDKPVKDRIGLISFHSGAWIDAMPDMQLRLDAHAIRDGGHGTDVASAIQLGLATLSRDAMHRMVLIWDGNQTQGDLESAISAAVAQNVPIDVMPMSYSVENAVMVDRFVAPTWKRENEDFSVEVILRSTSEREVMGRLSVLHQNELMDLDPYTVGKQTVRRVTIPPARAGTPGRQVERVQVPGQTAAGVHQFRAIFEADDGADVSAAIEEGGLRDRSGTLMVNRTADAFTFVRGKGQVLYVDNTRDGRGEILRQALAREGIELHAVDVAGVPNDIVTLQNYEAIILANVPRGTGGITDAQGQMIASYVHDMGGGLVMIGGEDAFGAGGWQGSKLEEVLPVNMDIPAQRQVGKGALVLVMHSCEMPDGNYWGEQCALRAVETLSERDDVGVIAYRWDRGGSVWEYELQEKGDGTGVTRAIKNMQVGDMKDFQPMMDLAIHGEGGQGGLIRSNARQKHMIVISDGDPQRPTQRLMDEAVANKITVSTITVYPHMGPADGLPPVMKDLADYTGGRAYGPINANPNQLPQIFIKEATVVRRSLIHEPEDGIQLKLTPTSSEMVRGIGVFPDVRGMVLTSRKPHPQIEMPIVAGTNNDPVLAHWQTGLGRAAVFTSDAHNRWAPQWVGSEMYGKFWAQVVRGVSRPPMSGELDVQTIIEGERGRIVVEAMDRESGFLSFLNIRGAVMGPDMAARDIRLVQTGPGMYVGEFSGREPGNYVVRVSYQGPGGEGGMQLSGAAMNSSLEMQDLQSNEGMVREIARRTGGRVLPPFDPVSADLFTREGVHVSASMMPIWDILIPVLLMLILIDVAVRRIAWDWEATKKLAAVGAARVRSYTTTRQVETRESLEALRRVRSGAQHGEGEGEGGAVAPVRAPEQELAEATPDPSRKFEAGAGVEGDIAKVVGGATGEKAAPPPPKQPKPKGLQGESGGHTGSLLEAKRRARQAMEEREREGR
jgi:uncharacterized membrane protein